MNSITHHARSWWEGSPDTSLCPALTGPVCFGIEIVSVSKWVFLLIGAECVVRLVQTDGVCSPLHCVLLRGGGRTSPCAPGRFGGSRCWRGFLQRSTTSASWGSAALIALSSCSGRPLVLCFVYYTIIWHWQSNQTAHESVRFSRLIIYHFCENKLQLNITYSRSVMKCFCCLFSLYFSYFYVNFPTVG